MDRHFVLDELAAWALDGLPDERRAQVDAHLAIGCLECEEQVRWVRTVSATARANRLRTPPPAVLQRAFAIFRRSPHTPGERSLRWQQLVAELLFDSLVHPPLVLTRGGQPGGRQQLYRVPELALEIDVLLERDRVDHAIYHVTGQLFASGAAPAAVASAAVAVRQQGGGEVQGEVHQTGEFAVAFHAAQDQLLVVRIGQGEILVPLAEL